MKHTPKALLLRLRKALAAAADPAKAPGMQAYMKSSLPYHGVPTPISRRLFKEIFSSLQFASAEEWRATVLYIWRNARFREERYAGITLCELRSVDSFQTLDALPMYEELIVSGAWWDYVDVLASHCLGKLLRRYPREMTRHMKAWSRSDDMWKRRASIICQLLFKTETDLKLLYACIRPSLGSREFFLCKAIGWALRQYAWTDPGEIRRYVRENEHLLSNLSRKEALKNL